MTLFHIPTAFLIVGLLYFVMPAVTWVVLSSRRSLAVALWCGGDILFGLGVVLLGLRGHVPEWATFPLANLLMFIAIIRHMQSLRLDLAVPWRTRWIALAALLFVLGFESIRLGVGDALLRLQYNQSIWAVMYVYIAVLAWRIGHLERSRSARWIAGVLLLLAVAMLTSLIRMSIGLSPADPLSSSPSNIFLALAGTLAAVIGNIAYVGLAFERSQRQTAEAEKQNRTMNERLAMAANVAAFGVWEYDIGTDLITWDDTMFDIYGIPKITPMQYQLWVDRLHPEDRIRAEHSLQASINEVGREELEYRITRPDNSIRYIQSIKTSLKDDTHQTIRLIGVNRDITERKRMEIELRNSEARYRSYFELPLTGRAVTSPSKGWLDVNATLCDMLGYTKTELTQMMWEELTHPDDLPADLVQFNRVMSGEIDGYTLEKRFIHKDGHSVHTHLAVNCIRKPDQAVDHFIALILDITERKKTERELRASREVLREMSRVAKVGGWNLDLKTHKLTWTEEVYRIREVDPNYQPQLEEGIDAFPPEARPILRESIKCAMNQGVSYDLELPFITAKGNHLWVRTIGNAEKLDGQIVRLFGVFQDITGLKRTEIALKESEEKFRLAFSDANTGMCLVDMQGKLLQVNEKMSAIFGYSQRELESMSVNDLTLPEDASLSPEFIHHAVQGDGDSATFEKHYRHRLGHIIHGQVSSSLVRDAGGHPQYFISQVQDITERKQAEDALRESEEKFKTLADTSPLAIYMSVGLEQKAEYINPTFVSLFGYTLDDVPTMAHWWPLAYPDETYRRQIVEEWQHKVAQALETHSEIEPMEAVVACKDGSNKIIQWGYKAIGKQNWAFGLDLTERKRAEEEIKQLAFYDPLTQLPNRRLLLDRLQQALVASHRSRVYGALLFIDLDNFKTLNDTLGHDKGDLLLQEVAIRLAACVRECDTVARLGGDEFVVMLTGLDGDTEEASSQTEKVGKKLLGMLNRTYSLAAHEHYCSASIGITLFFGQGSSIDELLKQADIALYQAKAAGRNALRFFDPQMQSSITLHAALVNDLRHALEKNQLVLYCQIEVDHERKGIGAEALLRWQHPLRGLVPPQEFIHLAEESRIIHPIGKWVMETACAILKSWEKNPRSRQLHLAVNISVRQFYQPDFVDEVLEIVRDAGIEPGSLVLELTESVVLSDLNDAVTKMNALKEHGVRFSLDDFGTGYSSLTYLTCLPFDQLKIDRSFVKNIGVSPSDAAIIKAIIAMANELGISVVAEGVETEEQHDFLKQHGCQIFQGYLFGKPVQMAKFVENLKFDSAIGE